MCDCFFWAKMTLTYEVLQEKTNNFNKNLPKSVCFDTGIRHFDASKPQRPLTPLMIGVGVRRFDRMCALLQRIPPCKKSISEVLILSRRCVLILYINHLVGAILSMYCVIWNCADERDVHKTMNVSKVSVNPYK